MIFKSYLNKFSTFFLIYLGTSLCEDLSRSVQDYVINGANEAFDITYINLEKNVARNKHVFDMLSHAKCNFKRFNAVNGKEVFSKKTKKITDYIPPEVAGQIVIDMEKWKLPEEHDGMLGCKLSHYMVIKQLSLKKNAKPLLILEDDFDIREDFVYVLNNLIRVAPQDWDIMLCTSQVEPRQNSPLVLHENLYHVNYFSECVAYLVNGEKAAKKIAEVLEANYIDLPVDIIIGNMCVNNSILGLAIQPFIAAQRRDIFGSDIENSAGIYIFNIEPSLMEAVMKSKLIAAQN